MPRMRIGDMLVRAKLIDEMQLSAALAQQRQWGGKLGDILVDQGFLDEMMLWLGLSRQLDVPLIQLPEMVITPDLLQLIPVDMCERLEMFPVQRDDRTLTIATSDPNNIGALDEVAFRTGLKIKTVMAPHREVVWAIRYYYRGDRSPCPPPRQRRQINIPDATPMQVQNQPHLHHQQHHQQQQQQNLGHVARPQTPMFEVAMASSPPLANRTTQPFAPQSIPPTGAGAQGPASAEEQLRQANEMLRVLVELCIQRGVFTREELWARLTQR